MAGVSRKQPELVGLVTKASWLVARSTLTLLPEMETNQVSSILR